MRTLLTAVLSFVFIGAFVAFFLLSSVVGYVVDPEGVINTSRNTNLREAIVELTASFIADRVAADPTLETMSVEELQVIVGGVITEDWLEESLLRSHTALKGALRTAEATAVLDLRSTKVALREALVKLRGRAQANCARLMGAQVCVDADQARVMIAAFEARALIAIEEIADEVDLLARLSGDERREAENLREGLESLDTVRMLALVVLIMSLAIIIAFNSRPIRRLILVAGTISMVSSGVYLLALGVSSGIAADALGEPTPGTEDRVGAFTTKLVGSLIEDSVSGSTMPVSLIGVAGFLGVALVLLLGRRSR